MVSLFLRGTGPGGTGAAPHVIVLIILNNTNRSVLRTLTILKPFGIRTFSCRKWLLPHGFSDLKVMNQNVNIPFMTFDLPLLYQIENIRLGAFFFLQTDILTILNSLANITVGIVQIAKESGITGAELHAGRLLTAL